MSDDLSGFSLMELFRAEAETHGATLSAGLLALEGAEATAATIEPLMRAAHSLKGAARIVGLDAAGRIAHAMEDCFVAAQKGAIRLTPADVDRLLKALDLVLQVSSLPDAEIGAWQESHEPEIVATVEAVTAIHTGRPEPEPPSEAPRVREPESGATPPEPAAPQPVVEPPEPPVAAAPQPTAPTPAPAVESTERVVRVTAESLTRLLALAGESLVQARRLRPFVDSLVALRSGQAALWETLQRIEDHLNDGRTAALPELLAEAKRRARDGMQALGDKAEGFEDYARRNEDLVGRLHQEVITSRMRPLADGIRGFPRLVRDVSRKLGKSVRFDVVGETTGVDRDILERLEAPLNHLIRNALDHGLEMPDDRRAAGKPETGTIRLEARHRAGMLQLTLSDDGRGIDVRRLRAKIVERGLTNAATAERLTEAELLEFLFLPGFSTKDSVSDLSGRGVGLDVVQSMVSAVGGSVRIGTHLGRGTTFTLQLPITRSLIRALLVLIGEEPYAFPLTRIDRILTVAESDIRAIEGRQHVLVENLPVPLIEATQILELARPEHRGVERPIVVVGDRGRRFGIVVERFLGERDLEVRPIDPRLGKVPDISSASVLEDGRPVLILDVEDLVRSIDALLGGRKVERLAVATAAEAAERARRVLVVDDSITVRELERQLLEGRGYDVHLAVDGLDGWNAARAGNYDLIISDVDMPRMDGIQFVRSLKADPRLRATPVVIVSYKDREEDRMRGLDAGADAYLTKSSFHDRTFLDTVYDLIGDPRTTRSAGG